MRGMLFIFFSLVAMYLIQIDTEKKQQIELKILNQKYIELCRKGPLEFYQDEEKKLKNKIKNIEEFMGLKKSNPRCSN